MDFVYWEIYYQEIIFKVVRVDDCFDGNNDYKKYFESN